MSADEKLERAVRKAIEAAPPLTDEQREAAAHLLRTASVNAA